MGGIAKTFNYGAAVSTPLYPCLKSKMGISSVATPMLYGHLLLMISMKRITMLFYSTYLAKGSSQTKKQESRYYKAAILALAFMEVISLS
jgi:hypothetical protein